MMKKITQMGIMLVALVVLVAAASLSTACDVTAQNASLGKCCVAAAKAGKGCCGKDAATVKAAYTDQLAREAVTKTMGKCCAAALTTGKGCCGKDAAGLKADYEQKVATYTAGEVVKAGMRKCCAAALAAGKGCCGKDAAGVKADYDKKVAAVEQEVAAK